METTHIRIIIIILKINRDKRLLLELIKTKLLHNVGYLTELAILVSLKRYHTIYKIFNERVKFGFLLKIVLTLKVIYYTLFARLKIEQILPKVYNYKR